MGDGDLEEVRDVVLGPASSVGLEQARDVGLGWTWDGGLVLAMDSLDVARGGSLGEAKVAGSKVAEGGVCLKAAWFGGLGEARGGDLGKAGGGCLGAAMGDGVEVARGGGL